VSKISFTGRLVFFFRLPAVIRRKKKKPKHWPVEQIQKSGKIVYLWSLIITSAYRPSRSYKSPPWPSQAISRCLISWPI